MNRKLKTYQTSIGFFDLVVAAPSMKAALEAWGSNSNLFHQGFAHEVEDEHIIAAALTSPGVILKRPVGTDGPFTEHPDLPDDPPLREAKGKAEESPTKQPQVKPATKADDKAVRKAALVLERQEQRERARQKAKAAEAMQRSRREQAVEKAQAAIDEAEHEHEELVNAIVEEQRALEIKTKAENERWMQQKKRLNTALMRAQRLE